MIRGALPRKWLSLQLFSFLLLISSTFTGFAFAQDGGGCGLIFPGIGDNPHDKNECGDSTYDPNSPAAKAAAAANERGHNVSVADFTSDGTNQDAIDSVVDAAADAIANDIANGGSGNLTILGVSQGGIAVLAAAKELEQLAEDFGVDIDINTAGSTTNGLGGFLEGLLTVCECLTQVCTLGFFEGYEFWRDLSLGTHEFPTTGLDVTQYTHPDDPNSFSAETQKGGPENSTHEEIPDTTHGSVGGAAAEIIWP